MTASSFEGVHAALVSPLDADGRLNEDALAALTVDLLDQGVHGVVVNGSTGEFPALTSDERRRAVETVQEVVAGRGVLTVHAGAMTTREAVQHAEHAAEHGAECVLLVTPYYEQLAEREIEAFFRAVAGVGLPIMIYNNPAGTGQSMRAEFIARLAEIHQVKYLKDTTGDARRLFEIRQLCDEALEILNGQDSLALLGFLGGLRGTVWGAANATPEQCVLLWRLTVESMDIAAARHLWDAFFPVNRFFEIEGYVAAVKAGTRLRGIDVGAPRLPILPLAKDRLAELERLLGRLNDVTVSIATGQVDGQSTPSGDPVSSTGI
jgi:4-hydroxy-tetrahydrodipicolinate synthase